MALDVFSTTPSNGAAGQCFSSQRCTWIKGEQLTVVIVVPEGLMLQNRMIGILRIMVDIVSGGQLMVCTRDGRVLSGGTSHAQDHSE